MMRKRLFWIAVPAAAAGAAAFYLLKKKTVSVSKAEATSAASTGDRAKPAPKATGEAAYSFISGFKDAATVELKFPFDAERFCFSVQEDDFLAESGDSHVGILRGEDFSAQFEYGSYYSGEDFTGLRRELSTKHADLIDVSYGSLSGLKFRDGDNLCLVFPIPADTHSYLLVTLVKAPDNDDALETLADHPDLRFMLGDLAFARV